MTKIRNLRTFSIPAAVLMLLSLAACQVNPVTGERHFQVYGAEWENQVGTSMYQPMKQSQGGDYVMDPELTAYVQQVGNRIARHARRDSELEFEFSVLNDSTPNAWALPGGKIVINRGLLTELGSEAELAAVLAHEIVHADAAHGARQQSSGMLAQLGAVASMVVLGSTIVYRSGEKSGALFGEVQLLWGPEMVQAPPLAHYRRARESGPAPLRRRRRSRRARLPADPRSPAPGAGSSRRWRPAPRPAPRRFR